MASSDVRVVGHGKGSFGPSNEVPFGAIFFGAIQPKAFLQENATSTSIFQPISAAILNR